MYLRVLEKKRIISSFFLFVFAIIFAHSIIPHHHHDEADLASQYSKHVEQHDDHYDDADDNFLAEAFSYFQHPGANTPIYTSNASEDFSIIATAKDIAIFTLYLERHFFKPPLVHFERSSFTFIPSPFAETGLFRGPPAV